MSLEQRLLDDLKSAMKQKNELETNVLRMLKSQIMLEKTRKDAEKELTDEKVQELFASYAKKLGESIEQFDKGGRKEMADRHRQELEIVERYLPEQAGEAEVDRVIEQAIEATGASAPSDMGKVMGRVMAELKGRVDGREVNRRVRERLAQ